MGFIYHTPDGTYTDGDYARFTIFETELATKPFGLVQRNFNTKAFFATHPNTGGRNSDGRVIDCMCRIDVVLRDKKDHEYPLLTPIIPIRQLLSIKDLEHPEMFMRRIERWAVKNKKALYIGTLDWESDYTSNEEARQKSYQCIDILLNRCHLSESDLADASAILLADNQSEVTVLHPEDLVGHGYDLREGLPPNIPVRFNQTDETTNVSMGRLVTFQKEGRLTNLQLKVKGSIVNVTAAFPESQVYQNQYS